MRLGGPVVPLVSMRTAIPGRASATGGDPAGMATSTGSPSAPRAPRATDGSEAGGSSARSSGSPMSERKVERRQVLPEPLGAEERVHGDDAGARRAASPRNAPNAAGRLRNMRPTGAPAPSPVAAKRGVDLIGRRRQVAPRVPTPAELQRGRRRVERHDRAAAVRATRSSDPRGDAGRLRCARLPRDRRRWSCRVYMRPCSIAARYGLSSDSQIARTVPCVAVAGYDAIRRASSWARGQSSARLTTSLTSPSRSAVSAPTRSRVAGEGDAQRLAEPDAPHQADRLDRGDEAVAHVRVEERRVVGADHDVGLVEEVERARGAHPVHRAHDRLPDTSATSG